MLFRCSAWLETLTAAYVVPAMSHLRYDMAEKAQLPVAKHVRVFIGISKELAPKIKYQFIQTKWVL